MNKEIQSYNNSQSAEASKLLNLLAEEIIKNFNII